MVAKIRNSAEGMQLDMAMGSDEIIALHEVLRISAGA